MATHVDEKYDPEHASHRTPSVKEFTNDGVDRHLALEKPAILQDLSDEETAALDKETTRKLDILLMPTLVVLYILNYLDRQNIGTSHRLR